MMYMKYRCDYATDIGKLREKNEDAVMCAQFRYTFLKETDGAILAIVADGMGGHSRGEVASRIAVTHLAGIINYGINFWLREGQKEEIDRRMEGWMKKAMMHANKRVVEEGKKKESWRTGTTATMAYFTGNTLYFAHVGDCRIYLLDRDGALEQLTKDHTIAWLLYEQGEIKRREDICLHPARNRLTRYIGQEELMIESVDFGRRELTSGMKVLICSDGLYDMVREETIAEILRGSREPSECCKALINAANDAGGEDNI
ncbi:MAG: protein phosphatase 2C domain-containing protein [Thermoplasmata archaeon]